MKRAGRVAGIGCAVMCVLLAAGMQVTWGQTTPAITVQPRPQIVQTGQTATFTVTATGEGTLSYQWRKDGQDLSNAGRITWPATGSSSTLTINNVTAQDVGSYDAVVTSNTFEVTTSWPARLALAGYVYATGNNNSGQLEIGGTEPGTALIGNVAKLAAGYRHSLAVKSDGTVWAWGYNYNGQLGNGTRISQYLPIQIPGLTGVTAVAAGGDSYNSCSLAVKSDGTVWQWGNNSLSPVQVPGLSAVVAVAAGGTHNLAVESDGTVWAWGDNGYGQLGNGTTTRQTSPVQVPGLTAVVAVAGGYRHSTAVRSNGTVWAWGYNSYGQLGNGTTTTRQTSPIQVSGLTDVAGVAAGYWHSLVVKCDKTVWVWGDNSAGQLGNATTIDQSLPIQVPGLMGVATVGVGGWHSLALKSDGTVWACGDNYCGQLGNGMTNSRSSLIQIPELADVTATAAGEDHSLVLKSDGTVWAWGYNYDGELGNGRTSGNDPNPTPVQVVDLSGVAGVAAGDHHSLAVKSDGTVWAWGYNYDGELGNGVSGFDSNSASPVRVTGLSGVVAVAGGYKHSLAVKSDGTVWAWGDNAYGQLGNGTTTSQASPIQIASLSGVTTVAAGYGHSLAVKTDGMVWAWGANYSGQMGNGTTTPQISPIQVPGLADVAVLAVGWDNSLGVKSDGTAWAWGENGSGQLGNGTETDQTSPMQMPGLTGVAGVTGGGLHSLFIAQASTVPPRLTGTWPSSGITERQVHLIVIGFDRSIVGLTADNLMLSVGSALTVQGSGKGPYVFAVTGLPSGTITATIGGDIAGTDGVLLPPYQWTFQVTWPGDINADSYVNVADLQLLMAAWGSQLGPPPNAAWNPSADANIDGYVNVGDLQLLVANWGKAAD